MNKCRRIRILHVIDTMLGMGGMEKNVVSLIRRMDPERFEHFGMRLEFDAVHCADGIKHRANRALRDQLGIKLLEGSGGGIARIPARPRDCPNAGNRQEVPLD